MHTTMTPWRNTRVGFIGLVISLGLFLAAIFTPFYSYSYFFTGKTMNFIEVVQACDIILLPFISVIVALVFEAVSLVLLLVLPKNKIVLTVASTLTFISAILSIAILNISLCRLWVIPYEFSNVACQELLVGYVLYLLFLLFHGVLSCYTLAINGK